VVISVTTSTFTNNVATGSNYGGGLSIYTSGAGNITGTVSNLMLTGNSGYNGGGIYLYGAGTYTVTGITATGNSASNYGGGISSDAGSSTVPSVQTLTIQNCVVNQNSAPYGGGIYILNAAFSVSTTSTNLNIGGGMYINSGSNGSLTNLTVTNNNASSSSTGTGGIYDNSNIMGNIVTATGLIITNNVGGSSGAGGLFIDFYSASVFSLTNYTLKNNICPSPQYDELHCFTYPAPGTNSICGCNFAGLDPGNLCLDCFSDVYGANCDFQCSASCPTNQTCFSGKLGSNTCVCDSSIIGSNCSTTSVHSSTHTSSHTTSSHTTSSHKSTASGLFLTQFYIIAFVVLIVQRLLN